MNKSSLTCTPSSKSSDDEEENSEEILLHQPSFSIDDKGTSACRIINKQLWDGDHLPREMLLHRQQSTNNTYSLEVI
jgi:hypothetical protein